MGCAFSSKHRLPDKVSVGVGAVVQRRGGDGGFLVGRRLNTHGENTLALPGGWLKPGESLVECAIRECVEEVGLRDSDYVSCLVMENVYPSLNLEFRSLSVFVKIVVVEDFQPKNLEPEKCAFWEWSRFEDLNDSVLFPSLEYLKKKIEEEEEENEVALL